MTSSTTKLWNPYAEWTAFAMWVLTLIAAALFWMDGPALLSEVSDDCARSYVGARSLADSVRVDGERTENGLSSCVPAWRASAELPRY